MKTIQRTNIIGTIKVVDNIVIIPNQPVTAAFCKLERNPSIKDEYIPESAFWVYEQHTVLWSDVEDIDEKNMIKHSQVILVPKSTCMLTGINNMITQHQCQHLIIIVLCSFHAFYIGELNTQPYVLRAYQNTFASSQKKTDQTFNTLHYTWHTTRTWREC